MSVHLNDQEIFGKELSVRLFLMISYYLIILFLIYGIELGSYYQLLIFYFGEFLLLFIVMAFIFWIEQKTRTISGFVKFIRKEFALENLKVLKCFEYINIGIASGLFIFLLFMYAKIFSVQSPSSFKSCTEEAISLIMNLFSLNLILLSKKFLLSLVIGIVEEFIFRGFCFQIIYDNSSKFERIKERNKFAIVSSASLFALPHYFSGGLNLVFVAFIVGLLLGGLRVRYGNLIPSISAHFTYDFILLQ